jgi:hypothetical protein
MTEKTWTLDLRWVAAAAAVAAIVVAMWAPGRTRPTSSANAWPGPLGGPGHAVPVSS